MLSRLFFALWFLTTFAVAQVADSQRDASQRPGPAATPSHSVSTKITYSSVHVDGPYIAMTFDDGPHQTLTPKLLDLLAQKKIKATFCNCRDGARDFRSRDARDEKPAPLRRERLRKISRVIGTATEVGGDLNGKQRMLPERSATPHEHSAIAFEGTGIVFNPVQPDDDSNVTLRVFRSVCVFGESPTLQ
jgi:hypothetical protein